MPSLDRNNADGADHVAVGDRQDAARRLMQREAQRVRDMGFDRDASPGDVEGHAPAQQVARQMAQYQMRIGHRRALTAQAVAGRPGTGAGTGWPDDQRAAFNLCQRTATGADRDHIDHRQRQRPFSDTAAMRQIDAAIAHETDIGTGAPDIDGDQVTEPCRSGSIAGSDHTRGRTGQRRHGRRPADHRRACDATVRLHQQQRRRDSSPGQPLFQLRDIGGDCRHDARVQDRRHAALVFANDRQHIDRGGHGHPR